MGQKHRIPRAVSACVALLAGGCTVGPDYKPPEIHVNPAFGELNAAPATQPAAPSQVTARPVPVVEWWTTFHDPELDSLIDRAVKGNIDVRLAGSRLVQARLQEAVQNAGEFPILNADGGYQNARGSKNIKIPVGAFGGSSGGSGSGSGSSSSSGSRAAQRRTAPVAREAAVNRSGGGSGSGGTSGGSGGPAGPQSPLGAGGLPGVVTNVYQVGFDASWEIDVFGGVRRGIEAAGADTQAAIEDRRSVLVSLLGDVARNYVELRAAQRQAEIARENLAIQQDTLGLTRSKAKNGFATQLDVARIAAQVATTAAELPPLEAQARVAIHALGTLLGQDPDSLAGELEMTRPIPPVPPEVPVGLPSDLLRRRPDVRRAERQLAAATARVGVATADLFPRFSLTAALGLDATKPGKVFNWSSRYYSFTPGFTWPIFNAGLIQANIDVQNEAQRQAAASYQQTVLNALKDVEDSLVNYQTEQVRRQALTDAVTASRDAVNLAKQQYQQGVIDFFTVLDTQRSLLTAEDALVQSDRAVSTDLVQLYKALGGGWEIENKPG